MAEVPDHPSNGYDDGDINISSTIATELQSIQPISIERNSGPTDWHAHHADNRYNTAPSFDLPQTAALDNPLSRLLVPSSSVISPTPNSNRSTDSRLDDTSLDTTSSYSHPLELAPQSTHVPDVDDNHNGVINVPSADAMDVEMDSRSMEGSNIEALHALEVARTAFITQESYGIPEFLAVIEQHTIAGSEREQWTRHVDALGEALRENEALPNAPTHVHGHPRPGLQHSQVHEPRKRRQVADHIMRFLDIEAIDDEDDDQSEGEAGNQDPFIDDGAVSQSASAQQILFAPLAQTSNAAFIDHLEQMYVHRASEDLATGYKSQMIHDDQNAPENTVDDLLYLNSRNRDWVESIFPEVDHKSDDWSLYGVKCKVGSEYGILYDILHTPVLESEVRSAFINPSVGNYLYVEAQLPHSHSELLFFLSNRSDIQMNTMKLIALEDHKSCLWIRHRHKSIFLEGTW
ncbi:hypothetical protein FB446DRAFT_710055, partial [Lentinula raphanica]